MMWLLLQHTPVAEYGWSTCEWTSVHQRKTGRCFFFLPLSFSIAPRRTSFLDIKMNTTSGRRRVADAHVLSIYIESRNRRWQNLRECKYHIAEEARTDASLRSKASSGRGEAGTQISPPCRRASRAIRRLQISIQFLSWKMLVSIRSREADPRLCPADKLHFLVQLHSTALSGG